MSDENKIAYQNMRMSYGEVLRNTVIVGTPNFLLPTVITNPFLLIPSMVIAPLAAITFTMYLTGKHREKVQEARDKVAERIFDTVINNIGKEEYILYLRPFATDGNLGMSSKLKEVKDYARSNSDVTSKAIGELGTLQKGDMEIQFADIFWSGRLPLIALDKYKYAQGAGRVAVDNDNWREIILKLAENAKGIFVTLVNDGGKHFKGTIWEIQKLVEYDLIKKCIFYMPPLTDELNDKNEKYLFHNNWQNARKTLQKSGIYVPEYNETIGNSRGYLLKCISDYPMCVSIPVETHMKAYFPDKILNLSDNVVTIDILKILLGEKFYSEVYSKCHTSRNDMIKDLSLNGNIKIKVKVHVAE